LVRTIWGKDSVAVFYTMLKRLWDELDDTSEVPICKCNTNCDALKKTRELEQHQRLLHFSMWLNYGYESIRGQILFIDPLANVNKVYCMIDRVEM